MTEPTHETIDSNLLLSRFEEIAFSEVQRKLIRAFFQNPASAWAKQEAPQLEGDSSHRKRPRRTSALQVPSTTALRPSTRAANPARAAPSARSLRRTAVSSSASASSSAEASQDPISPNSTTSAVTAATFASEISLRQQTGQSAVYPVLQEPKFVESHIQEEGIVTSYSSIGDIHELAKILNLKTHAKCFAFPQDTGLDVTVFSLYVTATTQEKMAKAVGKLAATAYVSLYPSQQLSSTIVELWVRHSRKPETEIRRLFKDCKTLGRACQHVRNTLGPGAMLLLDNFSACGTKVLSAQDEAVLYRCREVLSRNTDFIEQEASIRETTNMMLSTLTSGAAWRPEGCSAWTALPLQRLTHGTATSNHRTAQSAEHSSDIVMHSHVGNDLPQWQLDSVAIVSEATKHKNAAFSSSTSLLLVLWCFLDDSPICADAIQRGGKSQVRWTTSGELGELRPKQAGIDDVISSLLGDTNRMRAAVHTLLNSGLLIPSLAACDGLPTYTVEIDVKGRIINSMTPEAKAEWKIQALMLVALIFPRPNISLGFRMLGNHLLPHLKHTMKEMSHTSVNISNNAEYPLFARIDLCLALLAASEIPGKWKDEALREVQHLSRSTDDVFIGLFVAYRESTRMRVKGDISGSKTLLQKAMGFFADATQSPHPSRAVLGLLTVSEALNFVQEEQLDDAIIRLSSWSPLDPDHPSLMERVVLVNAQTQLAKVLRYQGRFDRALSLLEKLHETTVEDDLFEDIRTDIVTEFGNVLTEKNQPDKARIVLQAEIDTRTWRGNPHASASNMLHLSLAETYLRQGQIDTANGCYSRLSNLTPFASLWHSVALARVAHHNLDWPVAIDRWTDALKILAKNFPRGDSHSGHTSLGILKSMHVALLISGRGEAGQVRHQTLNQIRDIEATCAQNGCKHWIPGLNSYWMDSISGSITRRSLL